MNVEAKTRTVCTGITIELTTDEIAHLIVALGDYQKLMKAHGNIFGGNQWPWVDRLRSELERARAL